MSDQLNRLKNLCLSIDALVVQISSPGKKLGEDMKCLAHYLGEMMTMPAKIEEQRVALAACANPSKEIVTDGAKIMKRMRDVWECSLTSDKLVAGLRTQSKRMRQTGLSNAAIEAEIAGHLASNKERRALYLELKADYITLVDADRYRREAKVIRIELKLAALIRESAELNSRLGEAISFAEEVAIDLGHGADPATAGITAAVSKRAPAADPRSEPAPAAAAAPAAAPPANDDRELVARAQRGDRAAFKTLFERYNRRAYSLALGVVKNPDDALDVVQDAFIKAHRYLDKFEGQASFYTWLYRIVMNLAIDHLRKHQRQRPVDFDDQTVGEDGGVAGDELLPRILGGNPGRALFDKEIRERIAAALAELSDKGGA